MVGWLEMVILNYPAPRIKRRREVHPRVRTDAGLRMYIHTLSVSSYAISPPALCVGGGYM